MLIYNCIIVHYDEIGLKGNNRPFFENALIRNIREFLRNTHCDKIHKGSGKVIIDLNRNSKIAKMKEILKNIPGISNFSLAVSEVKNIEKINAKTLNLIKYLHSTKKALRTFKIEARRSDKTFSLTSPEINSVVGEYISKNTGLGVDVQNPDIELITDIGNKKCFIYFEKARGVGGLPVGTAGNLISLISGGIDSPAASFMMAKRGAKNIFVHFQNKTIKNTSHADYKIKKLVERLSKFQGKSKLYMIPFEKFQKEIIANSMSKNRMIIYRRTMFKIAEMIAGKENAKGFVTGDSLSQVASQTVENISVIYKATKLPIFSPLIGMNKQEIIDLAKNIGTYEISVIPYQDCCSFLIAKHPETKANLDRIIEQEKRIKIDETAQKVVSKIKACII